MEQEHFEHQRHPVSMETNPLGLTGFIISLLGLLLTCGLFSPVGLVISFVAMFRQPRGFAIAGLVLGLVGSLGMLVTLTFVGVMAVVGIAAAVMSIVGVGHVFETGVDAYQMREAIVAYEQDNNALPASIADLPDLSERFTQDFWGNPYVVEIDAQRRSLTVTSHGKDGLPGTADDLTISFDIPRPQAPAQDNP